MRDLVTAFGQSCSPQELAQILNQENQITRQCIEGSFKQMQINNLNIKSQEEFLASLYFPEIYSRQEQIKGAHKDTFKWIFDESGKDIRPWSNFIHWLEYGSGTYWISGKPGSGKSTLMNFILPSQNEKTTNGLKVWAGSKKLLCPSFFFWAAGGSQVQSSILGLLRSLIYQMLRASQDLLDSLAIPESGTVWTEKMLIKYLTEIIQRSNMSYRICFFIDGLDEFSGDHNKLVQLISTLGRNDIAIKFCIASRPDRPFEILGCSNMLRLQDLTQSDIRKFVQAKLGRSVQFERLQPEDRECKRYIFDQVVERADGVFLWVHLAVQTQVIGINVDNTFEMLQQRLLSLPKKIQDLYSDMLQRIDPFYYKEAAKYMRVVLGQNNPSVFDCAAAICCLTNDLDLASSRIGSYAFAQKCKYVHERILAICAGFLQVGDYGEYWRSEMDIYKWLAWEQDKAIKDSLPIDWRRKSVSFFHRTAFDYFNNGDSEGGQFLL